MFEDRIQYTVTNKKEKRFPPESFITENTSSYWFWINTANGARATEVYFHR